MKIAYHKRERYYLLDLGEVDGRRTGRILDLATSRLYRPRNFETLLAQGYWEEYTGDQALLDKLLAQVEETDVEPSASRPYPSSEPAPV